MNAYGPSAVQLIGLALGVVVLAFRLRGNAIGEAIVPAAGNWAMNAFTAFGTMSGFSLAALALVASLTMNSAASDLLTSDAGRYFVKMLLRSALLWFLPAGLSLVAAILGEKGRIVPALVVMTAIWALFGAIVMLWGLWGFMRIFTLPNQK